MIILQKHRYNSRQINPLQISTVMSLWQLHHCLVSLFSAIVTKASAMSILKFKVSDHSAEVSYFSVDICCFGNQERRGIRKYENLYCCIIVFVHWTWERDGRWTFSLICPRKLLSGNFKNDFFLLFVCLMPKSN